MTITMPGSHEQPGSSSNRSATSRLARNTSPATVMLASAAMSLATRSGPDGLVRLVTATGPSKKPAQPVPRPTPQTPIDVPVPMTPNAPVPLTPWKPDPTTPNPAPPCAPSTPAPSGTLLNPSTPLPAESELLRAVVDVFNP